MSYRRENIRDVYDERFLTERPGAYPRPAGAMERRAPFARPEEDYSRGRYDYEAGQRYFANEGAPRNYHEDQRAYHGDNSHFPAERRAVPPARREEYPYRVPREEPLPGRPLEFGARPPQPHSARNQGLYPAPRSLPESGEDTLVQAILNLDRGEDRELFRRKAAPFPPPPREVARSPHSRSGSSVSSRGYSPDRAKSLPFPSQQGKNKIPGLSREGSPVSAISTKTVNPPVVLPPFEEDNHAPEGDKEEPPVTPVVEEYQKLSSDNFPERRAWAISAKAQEIEKMYRQDCETFGMVVKMLVAKDANLEKQLQVPLRENLGEIRERCLEDLKHFIHELDEVVRQSEASVCDSTTPSTRP